MQKILILCTGNSCRSQMAEGFFKKFGKGKLEVFGAGIEAHGLNPRAVQVMAEVGVPIDHQESETLDKYLNDSFDYILTVCDNAAESCPVFPNVGKKIHHSFSDPAKATGSEDEILDQFRTVRDEIKDYAEQFCKSI